MSTKTLCAFLIGLLVLAAGMPQSIAGVSYTMSPTLGGGTRVTVGGDGVLEGLTYTDLSPFVGNLTDVQFSNNSADSFRIRDFAGGAAVSELRSGFTFLPMPGTLSANFFSGANAIDSLPNGTFFPTSSPFRGGQLILPINNTSQFAVLTIPDNSPTNITLNTGFSIDTSVPFSQFIDTGTASWSNGSSTISLTIVPEPSSSILFVAGIAGLSVIRRRK